MLEPGQTFASRYRVRRCIAEGGMGAIFEAEHLATERRVALKLLFPHIMSVASARQKFELEAKISARVNSPYIVEVLDAGYDDASKSPYLVMELLEGQTLAARVREQGPLAADEALRLLEQLAAGLDAAHGYREPGGAAKPIVHRDLKPENLFLARQHDGSVVTKILDYGIAKVLGDTSNISQEVRGTPLFMAFEQVTAGVLSPQTDVWAFGLIAYHMLTGARYWRTAELQGVSVQSLFAEILTLPLEAPSLRLREQNAGIELPPAFDAWLLRCIDRDPKKRFASAGAAVEALSRVYARAPRAALRPPQPLVRPSDGTQTFVAADARAAAAAVPRSGVGSVPALATTEHRRSFPSRAVASPWRWAVAGAGGVLVFGAGAWLLLRDAAPPAGAPPSPSGSTVRASSPLSSDAPASAVRAVRPGSGAAPSSPASAHPPAAGGPSEAPRSAAAGTPEPAATAPRIRIAPLEEAPPSATPDRAGPAEAALASGASVGSAAAAAAVAAAGSITAPTSAAGAAAATRAAPSAGAASTRGAAAPRAAGSTSAAGAPAAATLAPSAAPEPHGGAASPADTPKAAAPADAPAPPAPPSKRPRKRRPGSSEAYRTR